MVRHSAPSTAGQITAEAWSAMGEAAQRAGMPLDQWLKAQLLGTLPAHAPASPDAAPTAPATGSLTDLQRRMQELAGDIDRLSVPPVAPLPGHVPPPPAAPQLSPAEVKLDSAIRQINDKLEEMSLGRPRATQPARTADAFGERINDILRTAETITRRETAPAPTADGIEAAVAEIAARQHQLEAGTVAAPPLAPRATPAASRSTAEHDSGSVEALGSLRGDLGDMKRAIGGLAPRRSVDELQRTVVRLAERVERSGAADEELRATLVALRDMIGALRLPEHPAVMQGRIEALSRKIDVVNAKTVDGASIARLQAQASEIRDLLGRALSNDTVRLLAEQVALMASKISQIAGVDEAMIRSAISPLERRIDALSERIVPPVAIPVDDIFRRLDDIQLSLAAARREAPANMEGLFKGLSDRIERIERPAADNGVSSQQFDALTRQIAALAEKVESTQAPVAQLAGIERTLNDLFIQMEETRATVLANAGHRPRPPAAPTPSPDAAIHRGVNLLKREIAAIEAARAAAPAEKAPVAAAPEPAPAPAALADAVPAPDAASAPIVAVTAPAPASIPKPFEPHLMRAALEELARSPDIAAPFQSPPPRTRPDVEEAVDLDEVARLAGALGEDFDFLTQADKASEPAAPAAVNDDAAPATAKGGPGRVEFIAQARRAAQPASVVLPPMHSRVGERANRAKPTRWLARIRATLLIGMCGSAMAYGSWHLLGALRQAQLQAAAPAPAGMLAAPSRTMTPPAATPAPEDITGSVGAPAQMRLSPPSDMPAAPQATPPANLGPSGFAPSGIGPSSLSLPSDIPGSIGSQGLRSSALAGDPAAAYEIAHRYMEGIGVPVSAARAAEWFQFAASHGSIPAAYRLGAIYEKGTEGVPRDVPRARELYEQAASAGNVRAMHNLGVLLAAGVDGQPNYREAVKWFTRAAERGVRDSQYNLAVLYARGFGVAVNLGQSWQWFSLAAARGDTEAAIKRDEVAAKMDARTLAAAQSAVAAWTPQLVDAKANTGSGTQDWNQADSQVPRKTASR